MFIYQVLDTLTKARLKYALVGGYALVFHGLVRATVDVDLVLSLTIKDFKSAENALAKIGLKSRLPVRAEDIIKMRIEYIEKRNLLAWSFVDYADPTKQVDLLITKDVKDLDVEKVSVGGRKIYVATLSELLRLKTESGRPQDLVDIQNIRNKLANEKK